MDLHRTSGRGDAGRETSARAVARAGQLSYYRSSLSDADREIIHPSTISIGGKDMTVLDVVETYQLDNLREHFQDPESNAAKRLEDLGMELRRMQQIG